jgi:hypothetical protein
MEVYHAMINGKVVGSPLPEQPPYSIQGNSSSKYVEYDSYNPEGRISDEIHYPEFDENIVEIKDFYLVPKIVSQIYEETLAAIRTKSFILAGVGMRAIIEAICNDKSIDGNLYDKINNMFNNGYIAKGNAKKLHGIRFLGNDAVHDIKSVTPEELYMALRIINHLLETIYTLSHASSVLATSIDFYKEFKFLIYKKIWDINTENCTTITLKHLLGEDCRRIEKFNELEKQFCNEIAQGTIKNITLEPNKDENGKNLYKIII